MPLAATTTQIIGIVAGFTGLLAAVIAGSFAWFTQRGLARRRELWDARSVARLVEAELMRALDVVEDWLDDPTDAASEWGADLSLDAWAKGRAVLASELEHDDWDAVRDGCNAVDRLRRTLASGRTSASTAALHDARLRLRAALAGLEPLARKRTRPARVRTALTAVHVARWR
jgi:hypothetical protein